MVVFLNPSFMGQEMSKQIVHGEGFKPCGHRGDKWVVFRTQTGKEVGSELKVVEGLSGGSESGGCVLQAVEIFRDARASFLGSGELIVKSHGAGSRLRGEGPIESCPEVLGGFATEDMRQELVGDGRHEHA